MVGRRRARRHRCCPWVRRRNERVDATGTRARNITVARTFLQAWNEAEPDRRAQLLRETWTDDARYADPLAAVQGLAQIDGLIAGVQQRYTGFRFALLGKPDGHGDHVRFSWSFGPVGAEAPIEGSDLIELSGGRIRRVIGFLDKVPAEA